MSGSGSGGFPALPYDSVPQSQQPSSQNRRILTSSQHSELEMARRRAEKAAEGKRANAEAAKQRFKRKKGERAEAARLESDDRQGNEEIEQKLSVVEDQKEAKRLKRCLHRAAQNTLIHVSRRFANPNWDIVVGLDLPETCVRCMLCSIA